MVPHTIAFLSIDKPHAASSPLEAVKSALAEAAWAAGIVDAEYFIACVQVVSRAARVDLRDALSILEHHTDAPLFCGRGVVATYNADDAVVVVHKLTLH